MLMLCSATAGGQSPKYSFQQICGPSWSPAPASSLWDELVASNLRFFLWGGSSHKGCSLSCKDFRFRTRRDRSLSGEGRRWTGCVLRCFAACSRRLLLRNPLENGRFRTRRSSSSFRYLDAMTKALSVVCLDLLMSMFRSGSVLFEKSGAAGFIG